MNKGDFIVFTFSAFIQSKSGVSQNFFAGIILFRPDQQILVRRRAQFRLRIEAPAYQTLDYDRSKPLFPETLQQQQEIRRPLRLSDCLLLCLFLNTGSRRLVHLSVMERVYHQRQDLMIHSKLKQIPSFLMQHIRCW